MLTRAQVAFSMLLLVGLVVATAQPDKPRSPSAAVKSVVTVPSGVVAFASLNVAEVWDHKAFGQIREARGKLEFAWAVQSLIGVTPADTEQLTVFWPTIAADAPFVLVTGRKAVDATAVAKTLTRPGATLPRPVPGGKILVAPGADFAYIYPVDARTILLAPQAVDPTRIETIAGLLPGLATVGRDHTLAVGLDAKILAGLPLPFGGPLVEFETAILTADLGVENAFATLTARYPSAEKAKTAAPILRAKVDELAAWAKQQEKQAEQRQPGANAYPAPLLDWIATTVKATKVEANGATVVAKAEMKLEEAVSRVMNAIPDAALVPPRGSSAAENNLKQIGLAIHNYHDANIHCPGNSYDKDGKPLLSWRVHLLPYIEQDALYRQFKLDEPWDSPKNKPLSETILKVYQVPGRPAGQPAETYFRSFIGPKNVKAEYRPWLLEGESKGPQLTQIFDGTSNTVMVVEAAESVPWSKPDDLPYDGVQALPKLGGPNGTFSALFGDGHARTFRRASLDDTTLRGMITTSGGEVLNFPK
jgi:hypothetical protein